MACKSGHTGVARAVIQQCLSATLEVKPSTDGSPAQTVDIGNGMIIFISFFKNACVDCVSKIVKSLVNAKLTEGQDGKLKSAVEAECDLLIIPQACLGGKLKGTSVQYHGLAEKSLAEMLYGEFVKGCVKELCTEENHVKIRSGTYGNRQVLKVDTNGPYTHVFDF